MLSQNIIWGMKCSCGQDSFVLQEKYHPWNETDYIVKMTCSKCGKLLEITQKEAMNFYNEKIFSYFEDLSGTVLDLGCGGGFLTQYASNLEKVNLVYGMDMDDSEIERINQVTFIKDDLVNLAKHFNQNSIDYIIHRDVFMFVSDTLRYFDDVSNIVSKGIYHMAWYLKDNIRMKNFLEPKEIKAELEKRGFKVTLEYLDWYRCGYFIKALK